MIELFLFPLEEIFLFMKILAIVYAGIIWLPALLDKTVPKGVLEWALTICAVLSIASFL